jgi:predicted RNA-binding protein YlxR (DUF448 family)
MACETMRSSAAQTLPQRTEEVRKVVAAIEERLKARLVRVRVGKQGAVAFDGVSEQERRGITDACIYRRLMVSGSALARAQIARAEQLAGRTVDRKVIGQGVHSHDGGRTWGRD